MDFLNDLIPNVIQLQNEFIQATWQTIYMVLMTSAIAGLFGIIIGTVLTVTAPGKIFESKWLYSILDKVINVLRSTPFLILLTVVAPLTKIIVGTSIGTTAAIVPLVIGTTPFFSRQIQSALATVDDGVIEAALAMGISPFDVVYRVYLKEGMTAIVRASTITVINIIGLTTVAGAIGGGGLGNLAITYGYNRFKTDVTLVATLIILILVFIVQFIGDFITKKTTH